MDHSLGCGRPRIRVSSVWPIAAPPALHPVRIQTMHSSLAETVSELPMFSSLTGCRSISDQAPPPVRIRRDFGALCPQPPNSPGSDYSNPLFSMGDCLGNEVRENSKPAVVGQHQVATPRNPPSPLVAKLRAQMSAKQRAQCTDQPVVRAVPPVSIAPSNFGRGMSFQAWSALFGTCRETQ
jgi:hypothetical protein